MTSAGADITVKRPRRNIFATKNMTTTEAAKARRLARRILKNGPAAEAADAADGRKARIDTSHTLLLNGILPSEEHRS